MNKNFENALAKVSLYLNPLIYFSSTLNIREDNLLPTMGVNYDELKYNPKFCDSLEIKEIAAVIVHEIVHLMFQHPSEISKVEQQGKNPFLWMIAQEMVTNAETIKLIGNNFRLPGDPVSPFEENENQEGYWYDSRYCDLNSHDIYSLLYKKCKDENIAFIIKFPHDFGNQNPNQNNQDDQDKKGICSNCGHELKDDDQKCPHCGATIKGSLNVDIKPCNDNHKTQNAIEKAIATIEKLSKIGKISGTLETHLNKLKSARVPWRRVLATFLSSVVSGSDEYRWEKPNHRHPMAGNIIMPGLVSNEIDNVVFVIDTSGSIDDEQLNQVVSEFQKIQHITNELYVVTTDTQVNEIIKVRDLKALLKNIKFKGRGGTDFNEVFQKIKKCSCMVFFTDGYAVYPSIRPNYPVLWILTKNHSEPPFGSVAYIYD